MGKGWSIFFGAILSACFLSFAIAPFVGWWLPKNVASFGGEVDFLFYIILFFTGFFFVLTEVILVIAMWKFVYNPARRAEYVHGNHRLEVLWTVVPAAILLYIAFAQIPAWARMKSAEPASWFVWGSLKMSGVKPDEVVQVTARQWEWRMRYTKDGLLGDYAGDDGKLRGWADVPAIDDVHGVNELHTWKDANIRIYLKTLDVIHSFFMPNLRLKQDALPGRTIPIWFKATESNCKFNKETGKTEITGDQEWEIACAELCGGRHYAMRGRLCIHESKEDYLNWLEHHRQAQNSSMPDKP